MKQTKLIVTVVLLVMTLTLSACGGTPAAEEPAPAPTVVEVAEPELVEETPVEETREIPCMIAFDSDRDGNREIYIMSPDGSGQTNLTNEPADDRNPAWNPQGTQIAFVSNRETEQGHVEQIYVMNADGSDVRQLSNNGSADFPDWSPDGNWITYSAENEIFIVPVDGSEEARNLTNSPESNDFESVWSPDGSRIAWASGTPDDPNANLFVVNADGSKVQQLTDSSNVSNVKWTVDGQIFINWDGSEYGCCNFVMNADGSGITQVGGKGEIQRYLPFWTMEGNRVECVGIDLNGGDSEIYLVGEIYPDIFLNLTNNPGWDVNPDWPALCGPIDHAQALVEPQAQPAQEEPQKDPKDLVIGFADYKGITPKRLDNFYIACAELGIKCVEGDGFELIAQGVDAIVANTDSFAVNGLHQLVMEARDKGILVFVLDAESTSDGAYSVTISQGEWAKTGLGWILEGMGGQGEFAYFDLRADSAHTGVIADMLLSYSEVKVVGQFDWTYEGLSDYKRMEADVAKLAKAHPDLKGIWTS